MAEPLTLERLNAADDAGFVALLDGIYEHSPWVAERAASRRPFATLAQLKRALVETLAEASRDERLALLRAHPELAGKAMIAKALTAESTHEQGKAGLTQCTAEEFATLQRLNAAYNEKFGFPFMLAVRGPRGDGLSKAQIIATFARRLENHPDFEFEEGLRNVHRVAELRLDDRFGHEPVLGQQAWDCAELLATHSDPGFAENGQLTVTYLTDAHRACAGAARALDEGVRLRRGLDRRGRQRRRRLSRRAAMRDAREAPPHRLALRHGAQRRQVRRPPGHLRAAGLRARAASRRPAPAVRDRGRRLRRGGRAALQGDLPRLRRPDRQVRRALARPGRRRRHHHARGDAPRRPARARRRRSPS